jgi:hypothetical protein
VVLGTGQFLISLVLVTAAQVGIVALYIKTNPFVSIAKFLQLQFAN